jgi:hypothetical protein
MNLRGYVNDLGIWTDDFDPALVDQWFNGHFQQDAAPPVSLPPPAGTKPEWFVHFASDAVRLGIDPSTSSEQFQTLYNDLLAQAAAAPITPDWSNPQYVAFYQNWFKNVQQSMPEDPPSSLPPNGGAEGWLDGWGHPTTPEDLCGTQWLLPESQWGDSGACPGRPVAGFPGLAPGSLAYEGDKQFSITIMRGNHGANYDGPIDVALQVVPGWEDEELPPGAIADDDGITLESVTIPAGAPSVTVNIEVPITPGIDPERAFSIQIPTVNGLPWDYNAMGDMSHSFHVAIADTDVTPQDDFRPCEGNNPINVSPLGNDHSGYPNAWSDGGPPLFIEAVSQAEHGNVAILVNPNGNPTSVRYTPDAGYLGDDSFDYTATNSYQSGSATVHITCQPLFSVDDAESPEKSSDGSPSYARFRVSLSKPSEQPTSVYFSTYDLPAPNSTNPSADNARALAGADYAALNNFLVSFDVGEQEKWVDVQVYADDIDEYEEKFGVRLTGTVYLAKADAIGTIRDGDGSGGEDDGNGLPELSINDVTVNEPIDGYVMATLTVSLSRKTEKEAAVNFATQEFGLPFPDDEDPDDEDVHPATPDLDFESAEGTVTIPTDELEFQIQIRVLANGDDDWPKEAFLVQLSEPQNATIAQNPGRVTIINAAATGLRGDLFAAYPTAPPLKNDWIPNLFEDVNGIGIRRNGDNNNSNLLTGLMQFNTNLQAIIQAGYSIYLQRSSDAIQVWRDPNKAAAYFGNAENLAPVIPGIDGTSFYDYIEWQSTDMTVTTCTLDLIATKGGVSTLLDRLTFHPFKSEVILFNGEFQTPGDPTNGITQIAQALRYQGYDAFIFDEDDVGVDTDFQCFALPGIDGDVIQFYDPGPQQDGARNSLAEIVNAVGSRGVKEVSIIGYSHGGGATFVLSQLLQATFGVAYQNFDLKFTAYIDAVAKRSVLAQTLRPNESEFHVNLWQDGLGNLGGTYRFVQGGPLIDAMPGDIQDNVDSAADGGIAYVSPDRLHTNRQTIFGKRGIAEASKVQDNIVDTLKQKMSPF